MGELNREQTEAVTHGEGPLLVLAGAGSGKTRVLTQRVARLIREVGVRPANLMAVTFTNKAAREMRERIEQLLGGRAGPMWLATFHSLCARLLRIEIHHLGLPADFAIYDDADQLSLIKQIAAELQLSEELYSPARLRAEIDRAKNDGRSPDDMAAEAWNPLTQRVIEVYRRYQQHLRQYGALDFSDLLLLPVELFQRHPDVLQRYQDRFHHILVDEYQDTNRVQYRLLQLLAARRRNLCVVGDEDQSIYKWRGADINNILNFERDFPGARVIRLEQNYRSTQTILDAAGRVIAHNVSRKGKRLWTDRGAGDPVRLYTAADERDEARHVAREVERLRAAGRDLGEIAAFYRTNAQSRALEDELVRAGIPYTIVGATRFYDRKEIKDLLAYLRVVANPLDLVSLLRIVNTPPRGIGRTTVDALAAAASETGATFLDLILDPTPAGFSPSIGRKVREFGDLLRRLRDLREGAVTSLLHTVIDETGFVGRLDDGTPEGAARSDNVRELLTVTEEFDAAGGEGLSAFLEQVALVADVDALGDTRERLTLMTLHNSKGLEFPVVFLIGMEEGLFPHQRSADEGDDVEEERRLCYVGMTRARERLYLVHALQRTLFGRRQQNPPSRFLDEIPGELVRREGGLRRPEPDDGEITVDYSYSQEARSSWKRPRARPLRPAVEARGLRVGTQVRHDQFGLGTIRALEGQGESAKALVHFAHGGVKKLLLRFAQLEIVAP
jgi:DNA helicase-2/ATP-dependent DNA helicase PcrA